MISLCELCDSEEGFAEVQGCKVHGFYGSAGYDVSSLIWLEDDRAGLTDGDCICDDCIDRLIAEKRLELYYAHIVGNAGATLSEEAYRRLFLNAANQTHETILLARGAEPYEGSGHLPQVERIVDLRAKLVNDPTHRSGYYSAKRNETGRNIQKLGEAHATAALLLAPATGYPMDYEAAAKDFAAAMAEKDADEADLLNQLLASMETHGE